MEIAFCSLELRALFESAKAMKTSFGAEVADSLMTLLSDIRAAESIDDLIDIDISAALEGDQSIVLSTNGTSQIRIAANHTKVPMNEGKVAWDRVYMVKITSVQNGN